MPDEAEILHVQRPVEAERFAQHAYLRFRRLRPGDDPGRVAGQQMQKQKDHDRDQEERRDHTAEPAQQIASDHRPASLT